MVSGGGRGLGKPRSRQSFWTTGGPCRSACATFPRPTLFRRPSDRLMRTVRCERPGRAASWVDATVERFGKIDALVNNAGILRMVDLPRGDPDDLDALVGVNVKAPFRLIRAALPHLRKPGTGRVVNIASTDAKRYREGTSVGYAMTKHALLAMTQAARSEGWDDGVRATALCPGAIDTELIADLPGVTPKADRLTPDTVAGMVAFLLDLPNQASVPELHRQHAKGEHDMTLDPATHQ
jgi:NAD(P)-dependent dehydrogenase (short-subunit alcohol dehydrogenase family)